METARLNHVDLPCPGCGYNLRGLVTDEGVRCPECGSTTTRGELARRATPAQIPSAFVWIAALQPAIALWWWEFFAITRDIISPLQGPVLPLALGGGVGYLYLLSLVLLRDERAVYRLAAAIPRTALLVFVNAILFFLAVFFLPGVAH